MGFHNGVGNNRPGFPFTSTELVTIRNGFPQWIWKHQNWISSKGFPFTSTESVTSKLDFLKDYHSQVQNW